MRLVKEARLQGWRILEAMHGSTEFDFAIEAAFWLYDEEREAWRLYVVTPQVGTLGPLRLYKELQQILADQDRIRRQKEAANLVDEDYVNDDENLKLDDITLIKPEENLARTMRGRYHSVSFDRSVLRRAPLTSSEPYIYQM